MLEVYKTLDTKSSLCRCMRYYLPENMIFLFCIKIGTTHTHTHTESMLTKKTKCSVTATVTYEYYVARSNTIQIHRTEAGASGGEYTHTLLMLFCLFTVRFVAVTSSHTSTYYPMLCDIQTERFVCLPFLFCQELPRNLSDHPPTSHSQFLPKIFFY